VKACSNCQRLYADEARFCPIDGAGLAASTDVPIDEDPEDPRVGTTMCKGRYEVRRKVADGGMGRVYQALDNQEQRSVAIKVLHPEVAMDDVALERFKREFELSARLPHDHIVEVFAFEETEDESFAIVMEYLEGEELRSLMKREKLVRPERVVRIASQLALGLREPHGLKLVHRDIKPDNIFLCGTEDGPLVKLLDFGSVRDNSVGAKKLTMVGTTIGSPFYMSPEQAQGLDDLDQRADVWSIAAIVYEALTGKVPFFGVTGPQILLAILGKEPEPPSILTNADEFQGEKVPDAADDVIADALSKNPAIRIGSVAEFADRLGAAYGLDGDHSVWATMPEPDLASKLAVGSRRAPAPRSSRGAMGAASSSRGGGPRSLRGGDGSESRSPASERVAGPPPSRSRGVNDPFQDDEFVMGLPEKASPIKTYAVLGGVALLVLAGILAAVLR